MQQQERDLIAGLFGRLQQFENQPRDPEAERLIKDIVARQPASPYLLVQTVLVQEQALKAGPGAHRRARGQGGRRAGHRLPRHRAQDRPVGRNAGRAAPLRRPRRAVDTLAAAGRDGAAAGRRRLPAHGDGDGGGRRRRRAAVRGHPQHDGPAASRPVRPAAAAAQPRRCCRRTAAGSSPQRSGPRPTTAPQDTTTGDDYDDGIRHGLGGSDDDSWA